MNDTTGWKTGEHCDYWKVIDGTRYEINKGRDGQWWVWIYNRNITRQLRLIDAQIEAHKHARETK